MPKRSRHALRLAAGAALCGLTLCAPLHAQAYAVRPDVQADRCVVDPHADSALSRFWKDLNTWTAEARIDEINAADPGLGDAIRSWTPGTPAGDIQDRLNALGQNDTFGMLLDLRNGEGSEDTSAAQQEANRSSYTEDEARAAADALPEDPSTEAEAKLTEMADKGTALDRARLSQFQAHREEYNAAQREYEDALRHCADELHDARPTPTWVWVLGGVIAVLVVLTILRAIQNSRKPSRHYRDKK